MSMVDAFITTLLEWITERTSRVRLRVRYDLPLNRDGGYLRLHVSVTNKSCRPVKVTRIWLATEPPVEVADPDRLGVVSPTGVLTIIMDAAGRVPMHSGVELAGRAELADGRVLKSRP